MESDGLSKVVFIYLFLIVFSAIFSASEVSFINFNRLKMRNLANVGDKKADLVLKMDAGYDRLMITILICNCVPKVIATILSLVIFSNLFEENSLVMSSIITVFIILIFVELLPKEIAGCIPEKIALFTAPVVKLFLMIFYPLTFIAIFIKNIYEKRIKTENHPSITEDELITMIDEVENEGYINKNESDLIRSAIEFNETVVEDIYTPRIDIIGIEEKDSMEHIKETFLVSGYSRLPVFQYNIDHIIGVIHEKDFYQALSRKDNDLKKLVSGVLYVTPNKKISELLKDLQFSKAHMAIVIDEYGGTEGLVTMEDIIEELVGEIWDEHDEVIEWFKKIGDCKYLISCNADVDDMFELLGIEEKEEFDVTTVNGWVTKLFEEIPEAGDRIVYENLDITVTKAEAKRVIEICVEKIENRCDISNNAELN